MIDILSCFQHNDFVEWTRNREADWWEKLFSLLCEQSDNDPTIIEKSKNCEIFQVRGLDKTRTKFPTTKTIYTCSDESLNIWRPEHIVVLDVNSSSEKQFLKMTKLQVVDLTVNRLIEVILSIHNNGSSSIGSYHQVWDDLKYIR